MPTKTNFIDDYKVDVDFDLVVDDNLHLLNRLGLTVEDIISLSGGLPCVGITDCKIRIETKINDVIDVYIKCSAFELGRTVSFSDMTIENELMKTTPTGEGLGLFMLLNQIEAAKQLGFSSINLFAMGGSDYGFDPNWNGYYTWGRAGFLMESSDYQRFVGWVFDSHSGLKYLHEVLDTDWGKNAWKQAGFAWDGYFDLKEGSLSLNILRKYLVERGIAKHL